MIVAARATNQPSDKQQGVVMMEQAIANAGAVPREMSADAGYYSAKAVDEIYALGVDPFIAPDQTRHGQPPPPAPRGRIPAHLSARDRMRRKPRTKRGRECYGVRKETVESVFGQIKQGRGFRQFLLLGLEKVNGEWSLICTGHNPESSSGQALLKLFRFGTGSNIKRLHGNGGKLASARRPLLTVARLRYRFLPPSSTVAAGCSSFIPRQLRIPRTGC